MIRRSATTTMSVVLITALALFCLGDLVEAVTPSTGAAPCASRLCDEQTGCGTAPATPFALPLAALVVPLLLTPPMATTALPNAVLRSDRHGRQVTPLAPRSPPVA